MVDSESGFQFNPEHAFEEFDGNCIHDPERRANLIDTMAERFPDVTRNIYRSNTAGYLEGKAAELQRRLPEELPQKVFPENPKEFLKGKPLKQAENQARKAVPPEVMKRTDDFVRQHGKAYIQPFFHRYPITF